MLRPGPCAREVAVRKAPLLAWLDSGPKARGISVEIDAGAPLPVGVGRYAAVPPL
jgi:hypothetical protein